MLTLLGIKCNQVEDRWMLQIQLFYVPVITEIKENLNFTGQARVQGCFKMAAELWDVTADLREEAMNV